MIKSMLVNNNFPTELTGGYATFVNQWEES